MPYATNNGLPDKVKSALPAALQTKWRKAFNAAYAEYKDDSKASATAWNMIGKIARKAGDKWVAKSDFSLSAEVVKVDVGRRLVWGWASVIEENGAAVVDKQGDTITEDDLLSAVHEFTKSARAARVMHDGVDLGEVVETVVFTRDLQKALGVDLGKVGWLLGMEMPAEVVAQVEDGTLAMFSIGGTATREEIADGD